MTQERKTERAAQGISRSTAGHDQRELTEDELELAVGGGEDPIKSIRGIGEN